MYSLSSCPFGQNRTVFFLLRFSFSETLGECKCGRVTHGGTDLTRVRGNQAGNGDGPPQGVPWVCARRCTRGARRARSSFQTAYVARVSGQCDLHVGVERQAKRGDGRAPHARQPDPVVRDQVQHDGRGECFTGAQRLDRMGDAAHDRRPSLQVKH